MGREKRIVWKRFWAILLSLAMLVCGCGEQGSTLPEKQDPVKESAAPGSVGNPVIKAESRDDDFLYVAEKAEDRLQVPKDHYVKGITESGTPWGIDAEGNVWGRDPLPEGIETEGAKKIYVSGEGIRILYGKQDDEILVTDLQGERKGSIAFGDSTVENIVCGDYVIYRYSDGIHMGVCSLDIQNLKKGEELQPLPEGIGGLLARGSDSENLYLYAGGTVYRYSLKEKVCYSVFSWMEAGLSGTILETWKDGEDYYAIVMDNSVTTTYRISQKSRDELPKRKEIVIAVRDTGVNTSDGPPFSWLAVEFNNSQDEYQVIIRTFTDEEDNLFNREGASARLNASLLGTDPPDILCLDNIWYKDDLAAHGYLEDLTPYFEASDRIKIEDFYPEIISYGSYGDILYTVPYDFDLDCLIVPAADWNGASGWTYSQMLEYLKERAEYNPFGVFYLMRAWLLQNTVDYFVDEEQGEAHFDSPEFLELLEYMKECKEKERTMDPDRRKVIQRAFGSSLSVFGPQYWDAGEEYVFVGYPSPDGTTRTILRGSGEFAIVSTAREKEGAWKFLEAYLSSELARSSGLTSDFSSNRNDTQKNIEKELSLYGQEYEDVVDDDGNVIRHWADHSITQAHIDNFEKCLAGGKKVSAMNMVLAAIVFEQADAYFNGDKSAEEAVKVIQNRVKLYLAENPIDDSVISDPIPRDENNYIKESSDADVVYDEYGFPYIKNQIVFMTYLGTDKRIIEKMVSEMDADIVGYIQSICFYQIEFRSDKSSEELEELIERIEGHSYIMYADLNSVDEEGQINYS